MKVKFYIDSGASIHSCRSEIIDIENDLGITDEEWRKMTEEKRVKFVWKWANDKFDIGWEETAQ